MTKQNIISDIVGRRKIVSVTAEDYVYSAATKMAELNVAAVVVVGDDNRLIGIITERDITQRLVAKNLDSNTTKVSEIMTANPDTLAPDDSVRDALELMQSRNYRHLPVVEDGNCISMVSTRDLYAAVKAALEQDIKETEAFVFGDRYGV